MSLIEPKVPGALSRGPVWLFTPATRPDRVLRAAELADVVVIDCEDAIAPGEREIARDGIRAVAGQLDPSSTVVRINRLGSDDADLDLRAVRESGLTTVMVPKAEDPAALVELAPLSVVALCETAQGILAAAELATVANVVGLMWGSVDLSSDLGARPWRDGGRAEGLHPALAHARWQILLAARAAGVLAVDHVVPDLESLDLITEDARLAATGGYDAKACVHPVQLEPVRRGFAPAPEQIAWAEGVLATDLSAGAQQRNGQMIDEAVREQARRLLARVVPPH